MLFTPEYAFLSHFAELHKMKNADTVNFILQLLIWIVFFYEPTYEFWAHWIRLFLTYNQIIAVMAVTWVLELGYLFFHLD